MGRNLGNMGESKFKLLCASVGIICNSSKDDDQAGWDFILDFPHELHLAIFADMVPQAISCKVQVKATDSVNKQVQISLSNLLRLSKESNPVFIFFLEFDGENEPKNAYLVHIGKDLIKSSLKKSREISLLPNKKINKTTVTVKYNNTHKLELITGSCLKKEILRHIPTGMSDYIKHKQELVNSLGFENGKAVFNFKIQTQNEFYKMSKALLGGSEFIDITEPEIYDLRFNIKSIRNEFKSKNGRIKFQRTDPCKKVSISIINNTLSKKLYFDCDCYTSPLGFEIPNDAYIIRFSDPLFDLYLRKNGKIEYNFKLSGKSWEVRQLKKAIDLINWLNFTEDELEINTNPNLPNISLMRKPSTDKETTEKTLWLAMQESINNIIKIINIIDLDIPLSLTLQQLYDVHDKVKKVVSIFNGNIKDMHLEFQVSEEIEDLISEKTCCFFIGVQLYIAEFCIISTHALIGKALLKDDGYILIPNRIELEGGMYYKKNNLSKNEIEAKVKNLNLKYKDHGYLIFDGLVEAAL